jgi:hypothetical protein
MLFSCIEGQLRIVIVTTQMAQPDVTKFGGKVVRQELSSLSIA